MKLNVFRVCKVDINKGKVQLLNNTTAALINIHILTYFLFLFLIILYCLRAEQVRQRVFHANLVNIKTKQDNLIAKNVRKTISPIILVGNSAFYVLKVDIHYMVVNRLAFLVLQEGMVKVCHRVVTNVNNVQPVGNVQKKITICSSAFNAYLEKQQQSQVQLRAVDVVLERMVLFLENIHNVLLDNIRVKRNRSRVTLVLEANYPTNQPPVV